jgi:hypothetical protein
VRRGFYRIAGLDPGRYLVAVLGDGRSTDHEARWATFAPGTRRAADATVFTLTAGTEATADVQADANEAAGSIAGQVRHGDRAAGGITVRLRRMIAGDEAATDLDEVRVLSDDSGEFHFSHVPIGHYKLHAVQFPTSEHALANLTSGSFDSYVFSHPGDGARGLVGAPVPRLPAGPTLYADRDARVNPDGASRMLLELRPAAAISGRVVFQDGSPPPAEDLMRIAMLIRPAAGDVWGVIPQARIERDRTFRSPGLPPGRYVIVPLLSRARLAQAWHIVGLTRGGVDGLGGPITLDTTEVTDVVVTLSTRSAQLSGSVRRPNLSPAAVALWARVIVFPKAEPLRHYLAYPSPRRVVQAPVGLSGAFQVALPPGEYLVAAIGDDLPSSWMTPDDLANLAPWATPIRLDVGEKRTVSLEARSVVFER